MIKLILEDDTSGISVEVVAYTQPTTEALITVKDVYGRFGTINSAATCRDLGDMIQVLLDQYGMYK